MKYFVLDRNEVSKPIQLQHDRWLLLVPKIGNPLNAQEQESQTILKISARYLQSILYSYIYLFAI